MAAVPAGAVERLRKLEQRVDSWRTLYAGLQSEFQDVRAEAGRLETLLRGSARGTDRQYEVDDTGRVFWSEPRDLVLAHRTEGLVTTPIGRAGPRTVARYVDDDPALAASGRDIARLRREAADLAARRDELAERIHPMAQLAAACRAELEARGWQEGSHPTVRQPTVVAPVRGAA